MPFRPIGDKGTGSRAYVGLPSAPTHTAEPPRRAQMITIPAPAAAVLTNAKWAQRRQNPKEAAAAEASYSSKVLQ